MTPTLLSSALCALSDPGCRPDPFLMGTRRLLMEVYSLQLDRRRTGHAVAATMPPPPTAACSESALSPDDAVIVLAHVFAKEIGALQRRGMAEMQLVVSAGSPGQQTTPDRVIGVYAQPVGVSISCKSLNTCMWRQLADAAARPHAKDSAGGVPATFSIRKREKVLDWALGHKLKTHPVHDPPVHFMPSRVAFAYHAVEQNGRACVARADGVLCTEESVVGVKTHQYMSGGRHRRLHRGGTGYYCARDDVRPADGARQPERAKWPHTQTAE